MVTMTCPCKIVAYILKPWKTEENRGLYRNRGSGLHKDKIDGSNKTKSSCRMVPMKMLMLEKHISYNGKHHQRYTFLYDLQLYQRKRSPIIHKAIPIGWHLATILKESYCPRKSYHPEERPISRYTRLLKFQVTIPCKSHKHIAHHEQQNRINTVCHFLFTLKRLQRYSFLPIRPNLYCTNPLFCAQIHWFCAFYLAVCAKSSTFAALFWKGYHFYTFIYIWL